jgi:hypothetical protein
MAAEATLVRNFQTANPEPARMNDISFRPAGRTEETRRLIRQREHTARCWQLCCSTPITGGVAPGMPPNLNCFRRNRYAPLWLFLHLSGYALPPWVSRNGGADAPSCCMPNYLMGSRQAGRRPELQMAKHPAKIS